MTAAGSPLANDRALTAPAGSRARRIGVIALLVGGILLFAPPLWEVFQRYWAQGASTHGPILLIGIAFGLWESRRLFTWESSAREAQYAAVILFAGLAIYLVASLAGFYDLAFASAIPMLIGALLLAGGWRTVRALWLLEVALLFAIPISDTTLDGVFLPAKVLLTKAVVALLAQAGLPIADSGAVISIGFNTLLIANACTGLQSLWALTSVGLLYVFYLRVRDPITMILLLASTPPLAIAANFIRLTVLVLTSYYLGSGPAKDFHRYASYFEVGTSILMFVLLHKLILLWRRDDHETAPY